MITVSLAKDMRGKKELARAMEFQPTFYSIPKLILKREAHLLLVKAPYLRVHFALARFLTQVGGELLPVIHTHTRDSAAAAAAEKMR